MIFLDTDTYQASTLTKMKEDLMWSASPTLSDVPVPSSFMDWTFYASYVNNFNFS